MSEVKIAENFRTTLTNINNMYSDFYDDIYDLSGEEFDLCISHAKENGWRMWESAWKYWKEKGHIPFEKPF